MGSTISPIIDELEKEQMKDDLPRINVGDKVKIGYLIKEGKKERTQYYEGLVIESKNAYIRKSITVRKIVDGIGVEKTFPVHSPLVASIEILRAGKVRRAKLFYLRDRIGKKATLVKEATKKIISKSKKPK